MVRRASCEARGQSKEGRESWEEIIVILGRSPLIIAGVVDGSAHRGGTHSRRYKLRVWCESESRISFLEERK